jgi:hypothetical protein
VAQSGPIEPHFNEISNLAIATPTVSAGALLVNLIAIRCMVLTCPTAMPSQGITMKAYWVIDILKDIRQFSEKNGMVGLAEQLDDAIFVAASEIGLKLAGSGNIGGGTGNPRGATGTTADHEVH